MFKRAATELLSVRKSDVHSILLASAQGKREDIIDVLRKLSYFNGWSEEYLKQCCILAHIKRYMPQTVIADVSNTDHGYTYFVIDGQCSVIQKVKLRITTDFRGRKSFRLLKTENADDESKTVIFVTIRTFESGECFGLGEDLKNRWVLSNSAVRCLIIPRDFLLQHNQNNIWPRLRHKISATFSTDERIYKSLVQQVKWCQFKTQYAAYLRRRKFQSGTTVDDVPWHWRICVSVPAPLNTIV